jgi:hypothetical protein
MQVTLPNITALRNIGSLDRLKPKCATTVIRSLETKHINGPYVHFDLNNP